MQKTAKNRFWVLSNKRPGEGRMPEVPWRSLGSILEGFDRLLGVSWTCFGRSWAAPGHLCASLGRLWGTFGCSWVALGCIMVLMNAPGLDLERFWGGPGWVLGQFWSVFCVLSLDSHNALIAAGKLLLAFTWAFRFPLEARRYVRSTWNSSFPQEKHRFLQNRRFR